jgi:hypothetical protein
MDAYEYGGMTEEDGVVTFTLGDRTVRLSVADAQKLAFDLATETGGINPF